jgi:dihydrodipicolinate synthase/N-acetylneuraminate lyase
MFKPLRGVLPIVHTPFDDNDEIDASDLRREIDWAFTVGAEGLGTGMVSELLRLTTDERVRLTELIVEFAAGRGAVFAGVGAESTKQACALAAAAERAGCDAVMATPPLTARVSAGSLLDYYRQLADAVALPVIVQDASGYIGQAIPLAVLIDLLALYGPEKILFKPEAQPIGPKLSELRDASSGRAAIFEGSGGIALVDSFRRGIAGTMPGMDLLDGVVALWRALGAADEARAYQLYFPICALIALQLQAGLDGFLAIEKYLLVKRGIFRSARRREPNAWQLDAETQSEVDRLFAHLLDSVNSRN